MPPGTRSPRRNRLSFVLLPCLLFVLIPAFVLKENIDDLIDFDPRAFLFLALAAAAVSLLLLSIDSVVRRATGSSRFSEMVEYVCFFVVVTGFVLPASRSSGMKDPGTLEIATPHVVLASVLAVVLTGLSRSRWRRLTRGAVVAFVLLNATLCVPALRSLSAVPGSEASIFRLSYARNVLVLSFDGVSGSAVREALRGHPEIEARFAGFVFYHRVASSSPATSMSTVASLYGNENFKNRHRSTKDVWGSAPRRLLTNHLSKSGFEVSTYGIYNTNFVEGGRQFGRLAPRTPASVLTLINYALARALTRFAVLEGRLVERLDDDVRGVLTPSDAETREFERKLASSHAPGWKKGRLTPTVLDLREYLRQLHVAVDAPVAHFVHFTHTHYPVEFDGDCRFMGRDRRWFRKRQNWPGATEEARCVLMQASRFLGVLETLGVLERSLVILKSDHGKPWQYGKPGSMDSAPIRGQRRMGIGRYRPFLAIKSFGRGGEGVRHDVHPVMLDDLARTVCRNSGVAGDCTAYNGYDLLGDEFEDIEGDEVTLFVVQSPESTYRYETHDAVTVTRGADVVASLCKALSAEPGASGVKCDDG